MLETKTIRSLGLSVSAELWRKVGAEHPFGERLRGYLDFVPERYDRKTLDEAIAAVPPELADKLRAYGEAGLRHVVLAPVAGLQAGSHLRTTGYAQDRPLAGQRAVKLILAAQAKGSHERGSDLESYQGCSDRLYALISPLRTPHLRDTNNLSQVYLQ